jgi:protein TonB
MVAHALAIIVAVIATRGALQAKKVAVPLDTLQLLVAPNAAATVDPPPDNGIPRPPAERLPTIPTPAEIPSGIPPFDLSQQRFDPRDFIGIRSDDGVAGSPGGDARPDGVYEATAGLAGYDPAVLLTQPALKYPPQLLSAGVEGSVLVEFLIDTAGKVEPGSVRPIESSHPAFVDAARAAVLGAKFRPARLAGRPVRQITRQRVRFLASQ